MISLRAIVHLEQSEEEEEREGERELSINRPWQTTNVLALISITRSKTNVKTKWNVDEIFPEFRQNWSCVSAAHSRHTYSVALLCIIYAVCVYMKRLDEAFGENEKLEDAVLWQRTCGTRLDIRWKRRNAAKLLLLFQRSSQSHTLHRRVFSFFPSLRVEIKHLFFTGFSFLINRYMAMDLAGFSIPHAHTKNTCIWNAQ